MNSSRAYGSSIFGKAFGSGAMFCAPAVVKAALHAARRVPLVLWTLILAAALLAFFVQLLNEQVLRGEMFREEQRAGALRPAPRTAGSAYVLDVARDARQSGNLLVGSRQSTAPH